MQIGIGKKDSLVAFRACRDEAYRAFDVVFQKLHIIAGAIGKSVVIFYLGSILLPARDGLIDRLNPGKERDGRRHLSYLFSSQFVAYTDLEFRQMVEDIEFGE